jgi:molecular chaperone DnaK
LNEEIEKLKTKLADRDSLKAAEVKEIVDAIQKQSLKLFEAAYKKMATQNQQNQGSGSSEQTTESEKDDESKKSEQGSK